MSDRESNASSGQLPRVKLFTDGACRGNPGPGGWAFILQHPSSGQEKVGTGSSPHTTNNQMELMAVIQGLEALKRRSDVEVITDSTYVAKGMTEWMANWKKNNWRRREGNRWRPVLNEEYWKRLDGLITRHQVHLTIVRGHAGHPENERCDELAVEAAINQH